MELYCVDQLCNGISLLHSKLGRQSYAMKRKRESCMGRHVLRYPLSLRSGLEIQICEWRSPLLHGVESVTKVTKTRNDIAVNLLAHDVKPWQG